MTTILEKGLEILAGGIIVGIGLGYFIFLLLKMKWGR